MKALNLYHTVTILDRLALQAIADYERRTGSISRLTHANIGGAGEAFGNMFQELQQYINDYGYSTDDLNDREATTEIITRHYTAWVKEA